MSRHLPSILLCHVLCAATAWSASSAQNGIATWDPNMAAENAAMDEARVKWIDGKSLPIEGRAFDGVEHWYDRLPADVSTNVNAGVEEPVVFYGTSITQGACASRPGMAFVNIVGRNLDVPVVNLGFAGCGRMEREMSEHLARIDASCYVLDCLWNMGSAEEDGGRPGRNVEENYEPFIRALRARRPGVPIVMAGQCNVRGGAPNAKERFVKALHDRLVAEGWRGLVFLPGSGMFADDSEGTVDGVHPNDHGMMSLAKAYGAAVAEALAIHRDE